MLSKVIEGDSISFPIAWITDFKLSQLSQLAWCSWEQLPWNSGFWGSLKEKHIQWSGQGLPSSWQCIPYSVFRYRLASFSALWTSSHHFSVAPHSSYSSTILCVASNPSAPILLCCLALEGIAFERPLLLVKFCKTLVFQWGRNLPRNSVQDTVQSSLIVRQFWWHLARRDDPQSQVLKSLFHRPHLDKNMVGLQKTENDQVSPSLFGLCGVAFCWG